MILLIICGLAFAGGALLLSSVITPGSKNAQKGEAYECGVETKGQSWIQFNVGYYLFALIFLIFDVELVFLYPWAVVVKNVGMVALDGEKMSKSKGNLEFVGALMQQGVDAMAIRLALLDHHYRSDWEWTTQGIQAAQSRWHSWRQGLSRRLGAPAAAFIERMRVALYDDLDAPRACQAVDDWLTSAGEDEQAPADMAAAIDALLGVSDH